MNKTLVSHGSATHELDDKCGFCEKVKKNYMDYMETIGYLCCECAHKVLKIDEYNPGEGYTMLGKCDVCKQTRAIAYITDYQSNKKSLAWGLKTLEELKQAAVKKREEMGFGNQMRIIGTRHFTIDGFLSSLIDEIAKETVDDIILFLDKLEIEQPDSLKTDNWRNWKYIRNSIVDKYSQ